MARPTRFICRDLEIEDRDGSKTMLATVVVTDPAVAKHMRGEWAHSKENGVDFFTYFDEYLPIVWDGHGYNLDEPNVIDLLEIEPHYDEPDGSIQVKDGHGFDAIVIVVRAVAWGEISPLDL